MSEASSVERKVGPRVRTVYQDEDSGHYRYKGREIEISYEQPRDCWYIVITAPNGIRDYDGWWRDSSGKTHREAILEALRGAMLWPNTTMTAAPRAVD